MWHNPRCCGVDMTHNVYFGEDDRISELNGEKINVVPMIKENERDTKENNRQHNNRSYSVSSIAIYNIRSSLFVCDQSSDLIREVVVRDNFGTSSVFLEVPCSVIAFDNGFKYLFVGANNVVYRISVNDKSRIHYAGFCISCVDSNFVDGSLKSIQFKDISGIFVDTDGIVIVSDSLSVRWFDNKNVNETLSLTEKSGFSNCSERITVAFNRLSVLVVNFFENKLFQVKCSSRKFISNNPISKILV